jgi:O-acetyl-ADP-ribose deacetylase (regulator of RNase III)
VDFRGDVLVATANPGCVGGGALDAAVNAAGGLRLVQAREKLPIVDPPFIRCPPGRAVVTTGGDLAVNWVVHTVGPNFHHAIPHDTALQVLAECYQNAFALIRKKQARTAAFAVISGGQYRAKQKLSTVLDVMCQQVSELAPSCPDLRELHLVVHDPSHVQDLVAAANKAVLDCQSKC